MRHDCILLTYFIHKKSLNRDKLNTFLYLQDNYERDPSLSWQYFGSSTGFLRQYPAIKWLTYEDDPDMYDARMRDWYIKSAASPKDVVILLDTSGSMTGLRKEIAKHVVINIMETLGEDDFVTVLTFSDETKPLVECFIDADGEPELVQATTENIAEFTEAVNKIETEEIANFTSALTSAFTLLEKYRLINILLFVQNFFITFNVQIGFLINEFK